MRKIHHLQHSRVYKWSGHTMFKMTRNCVLRSMIALFCFVNREREMRIAARNEALQTATEQLQLKIQQKVKKPLILHDDINKMWKFCKSCSFYMYNVVSTGWASLFIQGRGEGAGTVWAFNATKSRHEWFLMIWRFGCSKGKKMFPLFYNLQQAETTRRHEQVLEHVKEKVNEILPVSIRKVNYHNHIAV